MGNTDYRWSAFRKRIARSAVLSILIAVVFVSMFVSFWFGWHRLVPRLGAIIVALGVLWEFRVIGQIREEREQSVIHFVLVEASNRAEVFVRYYSKLDVFPKPITSDFGSNVKAQAKSYTREMSFISLFGAAIVIIGTLVWAFGDWISCSIALREISSC